MTVTSSALTAMVLQLGRMRATGMDVAGTLGALCGALPETIGVAGAAVLLTEPLDGSSSVLFASDPEAVEAVESQRRSASGPMVEALASGRPVLSTAPRPPDDGFTSAIALPMGSDGEHSGVLMLLGNPWRPVEATHGGLIRPLVDVLGARLADVRAFRLLAAASAAVPAAVPAQPSRHLRESRSPDPVDAPTTAIPALPPVVRLPRPSPRPSPGPPRPRNGF